jgi:hypothetical protein
MGIVDLTALWSMIPAVAVFAGYVAVVALILRWLRPLMEAK